MFLKLTRLNGDPVWVNAAEIWAIYPDSHGTREETSTLEYHSGALTVRETGEQIARWIENGVQR